MAATSFTTTLPHGTDTTATGSCALFGHSYHEVTGHCHYCDRVLPMPKPERHWALRHKRVTTARGTFTERTVTLRARA
jgi:hypothetical protein